MRAASAAGSAVLGAAAAWAIVFGAASIYLAAGGEAGGGLVAPALAAAVAHRDPAVVTALWAAGVLKLSCGAVLLGAHHLVDGRPRRLLGIAYACLGTAVAAWGVAEALAGALVVTHVVAPLDGWGDGTVGVYYAAVWGPYWLAGGTLIVLAGLGLRRTRPGRSRKAGPRRPPPLPDREPRRPFAPAGGRSSAPWWTARWHAR